MFYVVTYKLSVWWAFGELGIIISFFFFLNLMFLGYIKLQICLFAKVFHICYVSFHWGPRLRFSCDWLHVYFVLIFHIMLQGFILWYEGETDENLKYFLSRNLLKTKGTAEHHGRYGVLIHYSYPDMRLFHSLLRGDFLSWCLQLLQWPLVSLLGVPDLFEESLLRN